MPNVYATPISPQSLPAPGSSYVAHGSLLVKRSLDADFRKAETYLRGDSIMRRDLDALEHAPTATYVKRGHFADDFFDPRSHTISWDPHAAVRTTEGGRISPALALGHEGDHAAYAIRGGSDYVTFDPQYDDSEERRVVTGAEAHAARTLGESVRHDHGGTPYHVADPLAR